MALTGEQIRQRLTEFAGGWSVYDGSERSGAHTFLDELFRCYGTERKGVATFEEPQAGKFVDLAWPGVCIIEMKRPSCSTAIPTCRTTDITREQPEDLLTSSKAITS